MDAQAAENQGSLTHPRSKAHLWRPGQSGNPGGRPKGLAARIRETNSPERLATAFEEIAYDPNTSARDRMEALRWLGERGYGKTPEVTLVGAMTEEQRDAAAELSRDQLLALIDTGPAPALPSQIEVRAEVVDAEVVDVTE